MKQETKLPPVATQPAGPVKCDLPESDEFKPTERQGLFRKFDVRRTDGSDHPGGKHHGCRYFVLDIDHDPYAQAALSAYAGVCEQSHPELAADLRDKWSAAEPVKMLSDDEILQVFSDQMQTSEDDMYIEMSPEDALAVGRTLLAKYAQQTAVTRPIFVGLDLASGPDEAVYWDGTSPPTK
ncbi:MAG TPA: hypothetical protein DEB15_03800 [Pusillimonas sp.]|jgi:hypothetical protein|nr:hypothetical protein [Pusillimonas sp.]|tara:strand:- start:52716 stop:53258 length:543 start_codon:yes stop_codon:yes gene_type:complete